MKKTFVVNPSLVKRLLASEVSSNEIAHNTGVNLQVIRSFRKVEDQEGPLVPFEDMRLELVQILTKEAKKQRIKSHDTVFLTKDQICETLNSSIYSLEEMAEKTGLSETTLKVARRYLESEKKMGMIRIGVILRTLDALDPYIAI